MISVLQVSSSHLIGLAHLMADHLRSLPLETGSTFIYDDDDDRIIEQIHSLRLKPNSKNNNKSKGGKPSKSQVEKTLHFQKQYQAMTGPIISKLHDLDFVPEDPVAFVKELEEEQKFKAMYVELDEKSVVETFQCLVQLTLEPPPVLKGEDITQEGAKRKAALDIVNFFKRMIRTYGRPLPTAGSSNSQVGKDTESVSTETTTNV